MERKGKEGKGRRRERIRDRMERYIYGKRKELCKKKLKCLTCYHKKEIILLSPAYAAAVYLRLKGKDFVQYCNFSLSLCSKFLLS